MITKMMSKNYIEQIFLVLNSEEHNAVEIL